MRCERDVGEYSANVQACTGARAHAETAVHAESTEAPGGSHAERQKVRPGDSGHDAFTHVLEPSPHAGIDLPREAHAHTRLFDRPSPVAASAEDSRPGL